MSFLPLQVQYGDIRTQNAVVRIEIAAYDMATALEFLDKCYQLARTKITGAPEPGQN